MSRRPQLMLGTERPSLRSGLLVATSAVAAATVVVYPLGKLAPTVSLGVVYMPGVLLVSTYWGLRLGLATALASALAFNLFHLPPLGRFTIADSRNWFALGTFALAAAASSRIAGLARLRAIEAEERRREAELAADLTRILLGSTPLDQAVALAAHRVSAALDLPSAAIELAEVPTDLRRVALELRDDHRTHGTLVVPAELDENTERRLRVNVVPALTAILRAALERDALLEEVVATAALRQSDELKTALLRAVSHDLRTPLTTIVASGHALAQHDVQPGEREDLASGIVAEGERLTRLVEKLLDLSRLETGTSAPRAADCSLEEPLLAAVQHAGGDVRVSIGEPLPVITADAAQLERAFANLVENAVKHSGGLPVLVRARSVGPRVVTRITDRGPGIPVAEQGRIFEPFYRIPGSNSSGAGLGLAIAQGFVEANGGTIEVESLPGQGTTFVVTFAALEA